MTLRALLRFLLAPLWAGICYFGGDSDSSQTSNQFDKRVTGRDGAQVSGDGNTVLSLTTDYGAVTAGQEATRGALALVADNARTSAALTLGVFGGAADAMARAAAAQGDAYAGALSSVGKAFETAKAGDQREVSMVAMAAVAIVAAVSLFGKARV